MLRMALLGIFALLIVLTLSSILSSSSGINSIHDASEPLVEISKIAEPLWLDCSVKLNSTGAFWIDATSTMQSIPTNNFSYGGLVLLQNNAVEPRAKLEFIISNDVFAPSMREVSVTVTLTRHYVMARIRQAYLRYSNLIINDQNRIKMEAFEFKGDPVDLVHDQWVSFAMNQLSVLPEMSQYASLGKPPEATVVAPESELHFVDFGDYIRIHLQYARRPGVKGICDSNFSSTV